ncbi:MAG: sulfotransferase family protein [Pseudomonadota bacterium]
MALINLWSGPRNVSTALMYSLRQRSDTTVVDEPLYAHFLARTGRVHPGRESVLESQSHDGNAVVRELIVRSQSNTQHVFAKHMAHHLIDIELSPLLDSHHVFLIRDPRQMLSSLTIQLPDAELPDTGLSQQCSLLETLRQHGVQPAVLDSRELLLDTEHVLRSLCSHLDIPWEPDMLHWPAGPKPEDGVWAPHWYHAVHQSTGFSSYREKPPPHASLEPLLEQCLPLYHTLFEHAFRARSDSYNESTER